MVQFAQGAVTAAGYSGSAMRKRNLVRGADRRPATYLGNRGVTRSLEEETYELALTLSGLRRKKGR